MSSGIFVVIVEPTYKVNMINPKNAITILTLPYMKKISIVLLFILFVCECSENINYITDLREKLEIKNSTDPCNLSVLTSSNTLDYTKVLLNSWKLCKEYLIADEISRNSSEWSVKVNELKQSLSFVGDNQNIILLQSNTNTHINEIAQADQKMYLYDARNYVLENLKSKKIIIFNEAHDRVQTRTFVLSILFDLKRCGVKYLAIETLNEKRDLQGVNASTGYYSNEPIFAQLIREAMKLGFNLISYDDINYNGNMRDSIQAVNLLRKITIGNQTEKTVVLSGYDHCAESSFVPGMNTMGTYLKKLSKIDPLTINQIALVEASANDLGAKLYLDNIYNIDSVKALNKIDAQFLGLDSTLYDIYLYFPNTSYVHGRPNWLITSNTKELKGIEIPERVEPVLVQAYLSSEIDEEKDFDVRIPYDQTFCLERGKAWLVLDRNYAYKIVLRDQKNRILKQIDFQKF